MSRLLDVLSQIGDISVSVSAVLQAMIVALGGFVAGKKTGKSVE